MLALYMPSLWRKAHLYLSVLSRETTVWEAPEKKRNISTIHIKHPLVNISQVPVQETSQLLLLIRSDMSMSSLLGLLLMPLLSRNPLRNWNHQPSVWIQKTYLETSIVDLRAHVQKPSLNRLLADYPILRGKKQLQLSLCLQLALLLGEETRRKHRNKIRKRDKIRWIKPRGSLQLMMLNRKVSSLMKKGLSLRFVEALPSLMSTLREN